MNKINTPQIDHPFTWNFLFIAFASAVGAIARYTLSSLIQHIPGYFPFPTLFVNVIGCFLAGLLFLPIFSTTKLIMLKKMTYWGFLPGFTLFATVAAETIVLLIHHNFLWSILNILFNFVGSILSFAIGYMVSMTLFKDKKMTTKDRHAI